MAANKTRTLNIEGIVERQKTRLAQSGNWAHEFTIGRRVYTLFCTDEVSPFIVGDYVRFSASSRRLQSRYRTTYYSIEEKSLELVDPAELGRLTEGHVYVLSNASMPGLLKVGYTQSSVTARAAELSASTGVPTKFKVEWFIPVQGDPAVVERIAHARLDRHRAGKEFFRVRLESAKEQVLAAYKSAYPNAVSLALMPSDEKESVLRARRESKLKELKVERAQKAYEKSPEGRWKLRGSIECVVVDFGVAPGPPPSVVKRVFGQVEEDWLEANIYGRDVRSIGGACEWLWRLAITGSHKGHRYAVQSGIDAVPDFSSLTSCVGSLNKFLMDQSNARNRRIVISVPTQQLLNPSLPEQCRLDMEFRNSVRVSAKDLAQFMLKGPPAKTLLEVVQPLMS